MKNITKHHTFSYLMPLARIFALFLVLISCKSVAFAQDIVLKGQILDKSSRETLPFCNIVIPQMNQGLSADEDGRFEITLPSKADSVVFYYMGYNNVVLKWGKNRVNQDSLIVEMESAFSELQEVVIKGTRKRQRDTLATRIYRNVIANKPINRPESYESYQFEEYTKFVGSFYNFSPKLVNRKFVRPFKFILENYDSTADGRTYVPLILKETITRHSYSKDPKHEHRQVISTKVSGIEQARFSSILDIVFDEMDVYSNQLILSGKGFMLPFADGALMKYRYFYLDSTENELCEWIYHLAFAPTAKGDNAFRGEVWIHAPTYAIQKIQLELDERANINWYTDFLLDQEFVQIPNEGWFLSRERRTTAISLTQKKKSKSLHLEQVRSIKDIAINQPIADSILSDKNNYALGYKKRSDEYWSENRHDSLTIPQEKVYFLLDTLKTTRAYKNYKAVGYLFGAAHVKAGPIELGSIAQMVSYNPVEGIRLRAQIRANRDKTPNWRYLAYGAYGLDDKKFKYGLELSYRIPNQNELLNEVGASYKDDYQRFALVDQQYDYDHFYNSLFRRRAFQDLVYAKDFKVFYRRQWNQNLRIDFDVNYKRFETIPGQVEFTTTLPDGNIELVKQFQLLTPKVVISFTPGTRFLQTEAKQIYLSGKKPRVYLEMALSSKRFPGSDFDYQKIGITIKQILPTAIGWTRYTFSATKFFGEIPFPLLSIHPANETFIFDHARFSNMREGQYAADQEISLLMDHHFDGLFLNRVPLIKKLQWREVFVCKVAYSSLSPNKTSFLNLPPTLKGLNGFYAEMGFGIENIFKILEGQFTWRLTQKEFDPMTRFVFKFSVTPSF